MTTMKSKQLLKEDLNHKSQGLSSDDKELQNLKQLDDGSTKSELKLYKSPPHILEHLSNNMEEKHLEGSSEKQGSAFLSRVVKEFEEIDEDQEMKNVSSQSEVESHV